MLLRGKKLLTLLSKEINPQKVLSFSCILFLILGVFLGIIFFQAQISYYQHKSVYRDVENPILREYFKTNRIEREQDLLHYAFYDKMIEGDKIHRPIKELSQIQKANDSFFIRSSLYRDAYNKINLTKHSSILLNKKSTSILNISFTIEGSDKIYSAYAYGDFKPSDCKNNKKSALIIPGSNQNQSSEIYSNNPTNYHHGILDALASAVDKIYVFIKPNEDTLAIHNGSRKLSNNFIINYHLNRGGSYTVSYLVQSLALTKFLKSCYKKTFLAGLSQGGGAVLLNALQSEPDAAIVASGYSIVNKNVEWGGNEQIIIPTGEWAELSNPSILEKKLSNLKTQFFLAGAKEKLALINLKQMISSPVKRSTT